MARTKQEVFDDLEARKDADSILAPVLTSMSKSAYWRAVFWLIASVISDFEKTFDDFEQSLSELLDSKQIHTAAWWRRISLEFQLGDSLEQLDNGNLAYPTVNEEARIIQRVAVTSPAISTALVKVAKLDVNGAPIPLETNEISAFKSYLNDIAPFTISSEVVSELGDQVKVGATVEVDTQVIDVTTGALLSDSTVFPVIDAISNYFATFAGDDFGGTFYGNRLLQEIITAEGVLNATYDLLEKLSTGDPAFVDVLTLSGKKFDTFAGYVRIADGFDLPSNITYTPVE